MSINGLKWLSGENLPLLIVNYCGPFFKTSFLQVCLLHYTMIERLLKTYLFHIIEVFQDPAFLAFVPAVDVFIYTIPKDQIQM